MIDAQAFSIYHVFQLSAISHVHPLLPALASQAPRGPILGCLISSQWPLNHSNSLTQDDLCQRWNIAYTVYFGHVEGDLAERGLGKVKLEAINANGNVQGVIVHARLGMTMCIVGK